MTRSTTSTPATRRATIDPELRPHMPDPLDPPYSVIVELIDSPLGAELLRSVEKFGWQFGRNLADWLAILVEELGEAAAVAPWPVGCQALPGLLTIAGNVAREINEANIARRTPAPDVLSPLLIRLAQGAERMAAFLPEDNSCRRELIQVGAMALKMHIVATVKALPPDPRHPRYWEKTA